MTGQYAAVLVDSAVEKSVEIEGASSSRQEARLGTSVDAIPMQYGKQAEQGTKNGPYIVSKLQQSFCPQG